MWIVVKYKKNQLDFLKGNLLKFFDHDIEFFYPKIKIKNNKIKYSEKNILGDYLIIFSKKIKNKFFLNNLKFMKGMKRVLENFNYHQKQISDFIQHCKDFQNSDGFLEPDFFNEIFNKKKLFTSGLFADKFFNIILENNKYFKILIDDKTITIPKSSSYFFNTI